VGILHQFEWQYGNHIVFRLLINRKADEPPSGWGMMGRFSVWLWFGFEGKLIPFVVGEA